MKKAYLVMLLITAFFNIQSQNFQWAKREGLNAYDYGYGIVNDAAGNVYVAGKYEENANFSGTIMPNSSTNHDIFIAKYSSLGGLSWVRSGGGTLGDYAHCLAIDGNSSVVIAGEIEGINETITFPGSTITLTAVGDNDIFLAKYDLNGTLLWAKSEGTWRSEKALGAAVDGSGNIFITGYFTDTTAFNGTQILGAGLRDMFIAKYDANGNFIWVQHAGGPQRDEGLAIKCDAAGNAYVCGMHSDGALFGTTTLNTTGTFGYFDGYIAKYSPAGALVWVKNIGGDYDDVVWSLTLDNAGKIYAAGEFNGYASFGTHTLTTSSVLADGFAACYDANGTEQWVSQISGTLVDRPRAIATDGNDLFITGQFGGTSVFGTTTLTAADSSDIFIAALNNTGTFLWAAAVSGPADAYENLGYESGDGICAQAGAVYATGAILDGGTFGSTTLMPYSRTDVFIAKLSTAVGINESEIKNNGLHIYPNPSSALVNVDLSAFANQKIKLQVLNYIGQVIEIKTEKINSNLVIDLSHNEKGIYFIEIETAEKVYREKIVIQ